MRESISRYSGARILAMNLPLARAATPLAQPADSPVAGSTIVAAVIGAGADVTTELFPLMREALPPSSRIGRMTVQGAMECAQRTELRPQPPRMFFFDSRAGSARDFTAQFQPVLRAHPTAEFVVVVSEADPEVIPACLKVAELTDRLTFVLAPISRAAAVATLRAVAGRLLDKFASRHESSRRDNERGHFEDQIVALQERLKLAKHAALHDNLTGILNRMGFTEVLTARLRRAHQRQIVIMIDLDRFKAVNDALGHAAGDELVRRICTAMSGVIPGGAVLARLGGDEFGITIERSAVPRVESLCEKLLQVCNQCRIIAGHEVQVSASIGVALQDATPSELELMRQADLALYAAKRAGRNRYRIYDDALDHATEYRHSIERKLESAMRVGQLKMAYQPIVDARTSAVLGFESLVRWNSPEFGEIPPAEFIPIAEESGLILDLGEWIARQSLKDCRRWNLPYVSINLSARQFLRHNVGERILRYASDADVSPRRIQIELTETAIVDDVERANHNLNLLRRAGVRVALDDFGTGYSSLVYLNQFAIDCIKIDKSFVDNIAVDAQSAVIVGSVTRLAASLGMSVVAEGVETEAQRAALLAAGCGAQQGFHFGRPGPASMIGALVSRPPGQDRPEDDSPPLAVAS
jgi:diguanylate cyclase (GGDEF)-like protein